MYTNQTQLPSNNLQNDFKGPKTPILLMFFSKRLTVTWAIIFVCAKAIVPIAQVKARTATLKGF